MRFNIVMAVWLIVLAVLLLWGLIRSLRAQEPPLPQQPLVIRHTNLVTNVVISITTTIQEVQGIKVDNRFIPLRTNLLFRSATNVWSTP